MRILILTPWLPYPPEFGGGIRIYELIKNLSLRHRVSLLTYAEPGQEARISALQSLCEAVHTVLPDQSSDRHEGKRSRQLATLFSTASYQRRSTYTPQMQAAIDTLLATEDFDIVQVEFSQMGAFDFKTRAVIVLDEHNIEYELLYRTHCSERSPARKLYNGLEFVKFRAEEQRAWHKVDACLLTSCREEEILHGVLPKKRTAVIPNGVDIENFKSTGETHVNPNSIVFTGLMKYRPNIDGVLYFVKEVLPQILKVRPAVVFSIVGQGPTEEIQRLAGPNVVVTGRVPEVRSYLDQAAAVVVPLRMGSGTRLKVLEALAMGKAIISTSLGCEGINVSSGKHLLVADDPTHFAQSVLKILDDPTLAECLGQCGRTLAEEEYGWASITKDLEDFYSQLLCRPELKGNLSY